jgi:undecaprenyl-diphosphatase
MWLAHNRDIDIDITLTLLRLAAVIFVMAALLCLALVGPGWLAGGFYVVLAGLAVKVDGGTITKLDTAVQDWLRAHRSQGGQGHAGEVFSYIGQPVHFAVIVVFCAVVLSLHARSAMRGTLLVAVVGTAVIAEQALKALIVRTTHPLAEYAHFFPSGHVTVWASFLGMVAVFLGTGRSRTTRMALGLVAVDGVLAVAFLAIYTGAHVFSDVIGGMFLGAAMVASGAALLRTTPSRVRVARAGGTATVSDHTAPIRADDILLGRGFQPPARSRYSSSTGRSGW